MDLTSISSLTNTSSSTSTAASSSAADSVSKDDFLQLLITQLQSQDPLDPQDSTEFTQQLATFSSLEQLFSINDGIQSLQLLNLSNTNSLTLNLIGKEITASGGNISVTDSSITPISFEIEEDAEKVTLTITDSNGNVVKTVDLGKQTSGTHSFTWDGKLDDGSTASTGDYTFEITAVDSSGEVVTVNTYTTGIVTGIQFENGIAYAIVDGQKIPVSDITEVSSVSV